MIEKVCRPPLAADEAAEAKSKQNGQDQAA